MRKLEFLGDHAITFSETEYLPPVEYEEANGIGRMFVYSLYDVLLLARRGPGHVFSKDPKKNRYVVNKMSKLVHILILGA